MKWILLAAQIQAQSCISLAGSKYCTELKDYSIRTFAPVTNAQQFDLYLEAEAAYNFGDGCPGWRSAGGSNFKYSKSTACAVAVYLSSKEGPDQCNKGSPPPPLLCKSSVQLTFSDIETKLKQVTLINKFCPNTKMFPGYVEYFGILQDTGCNIGFGLDGQNKCSLTRKEQADQFCQQNSQALCCTSTTNIIAAANTTQSIDPKAAATTSTAGSSGKSSVVNPLFIGLAAMGVILIVIIASAVYFIRRKKTGINSSGSRKYDSKRDTFGSSAPNSKHESQISSAPNSGVMEAIFDYQANLFDELTLSKIALI